MHKTRSLMYPTSLASASLCMTCLLSHRPGNGILRQIQSEEPRELRDVRGDGRADSGAGHSQRGQRRQLANGGGYLRDGAALVGAGKRESAKGEGESRAGPAAQLWNYRTRTTLPNTYGTAHPRPPRTERSSIFRPARPLRATIMLERPPVKPTEQGRGGRRCKTGQAKRYQHGEGTGYERDPRKMCIHYT